MAVEHLGDYGHSVTYIKHTPDGVQQRLLELAELFAGCRAIYFDLVDEQHWRPVAGSAAEADQRSLPPAANPHASMFRPSGFDCIVDVMASYLLVAASHLGGLAALHAEGEVMFSPGMLVRGVVENCAHVFWLIGPGGAEPASAKLARGYLEEDLSAEEAKKNAGRMGGKNSQQYKDAVEARRRVRREISDRFPGTSAEDLGLRQIDGQMWLSPEKCVEAMYAFLAERTAASIDARIAVGVYGYLSNLTHPTLYPVRELREWEVDVGAHAGHAAAISVLPVGFLERQASVAAVSFFNTVSYVTSYFGWPGHHHERFAELLSRALPDSIHGSGQRT